MKGKTDEKLVIKGYEQPAEEVYAGRGVDVDKAIEAMKGVPISMNCWQADDVLGFDGGQVRVPGGTATTGNYPGRARTADELRADADKAMSMIPGEEKFNLHASYANLHGRKIERSEYTAELFSEWMDWAKERGMGLDFNPTYFSHPMVKTASRWPPR